MSHSTIIHADTAATWELDPEEARQEAKLLRAARTLQRIADILEGLPAHRAYVVDALGVDGLRQEMDRQMEGIRQELTGKAASDADYLVSTIQITDTAEHITPGVYTIRHPAHYDAAEISAGDILNDGLIWIIPDTQLEELRGEDAIGYARATGRTLYMKGPNRRYLMTVEEAEDVPTAELDSIWIDVEVSG